ncbi:hypothetical protein G6L37_02560 [Agrobacterium rubi]|nr:hypothetical protein [Agrobacterium rubi]NTF24278.1 hypothetical protein [Agrobacterium rubi]
MNNNQLASTAFDKLNSIKKKHESDRQTAVSMMKKIYSSYNALKDSFSKLTIEHNQAKKDLERAHAEIRRLEKANGELSNDVVMLSSAVSLLDQTVGEGDDILIDSIRDVVRDFKLEDVPMTVAATATIELSAATVEKVPALVQVSASAREPFVMPELVSDEEVEAVSAEELLSGDEVAKIEQFLNEELKIDMDIRN